ncbi:MAG: translation initiation factor IF-2 N-terminal domain-containing protein [Planctomycetota bacterium]
MAATRVYLLAKELGVKSTAIVKKCQDEGLDVKNHMGAISAGLAATIREWFSDGEHTTTVEIAEKVDLKKVRIKKKQGRFEEGSN